MTKYWRYISYIFRLYKSLCNNKMHWKKFTIDLVKILLRFIWVIVYILIKNDSLFPDGLILFRIEAANFKIITSYCDDVHFSSKLQKNGFLSEKSVILCYLWSDLFIKNYIYFLNVIWLYCLYIYWTFLNIFFHTQ